MKRVCSTLFVLLLAAAMLLLPAGCAKNADTGEGGPVSTPKGEPIPAVAANDAVVDSPVCVAADGTVFYADDKGIMQIAPGKEAEQVFKRAEVAGLPIAADASHIYFYLGGVDVDDIEAKRQVHRVSRADGERLTVAIPEEFTRVFEIKNIYVQGGQAYIVTSDGTDKAGAEIYRTSAGFDALSQLVSFVDTEQVFLGICGEYIYFQTTRTVQNEQDGGSIIYTDILRTPLSAPSLEGEAFFSTEYYDLELPLITGDGYIIIKDTQFSTVRIMAETGARNIILTPDAGTQLLFVHNERLYYAITDAGDGKQDPTNKLYSVKLDGSDNQPIGEAYSGKWQIAQNKLGPQMNISGNTLYLSCYVGTYNDAGEQTEEHLQIISIDLTTGEQNELAKLKIG
ncbi:hypothetical protein LJC55_04305 [Eubacteriales bacterium OttesenSCG-928-N14]|nr:hypothetical protein [Eubacteriales bacterium OttesenSCG-928-N14]